MKKTLITLLSFTITVFIVFSQVKTPTPPKIRMVTITLTENTWRVMLYVIDKSDMPHPTVRAIQDSISIQYNDTIKNPFPR